MELKKMRNLILVIALSLSASSALAHSLIDKTYPADGEKLAELPIKVEIDFINDFRLTKVKWTHAGKHSQKINLDGQTNFTTEFEFPFKGLGPGHYLIEWRGLGSDGHPQNGSFRFTVE